MRLSTKGRFAVAAMIDVALRQKNGPVALSDIATRHQISLSYLEQMFSRLRHDGLVQSTRGPGGGYALGHRAEEITVADIIGSVDGRGDLDDRRARHISNVHATEGSTGVSDACDATDVTQDLWNAFNARMEDYMQSVTLRSLVLEQLAKGFVADAPANVQRGVFKKPQAKPVAVRSAVPNSVFALGNVLLGKG